MKLAALFSGGKDSTFAIHKAIESGHDVVCLLTILPYSESSLLLHHPNSRWTSLQAESMRLPQILVNSKSDSIEDELDALEEAILKAKQYSIEGVVHGGLASNFQRKNYEKLCAKHGLVVVAPLWNKEQLNYMLELVSSNFEFIITSVSAGGLGKEWLGKKITLDDLKKLEQLSKKYGFNIAFEGGEAETFVTNCPLFKKEIIIKKSSVFWDGYRGIFEILEAGTRDNA